MIPSIGIANSFLGGGAATEEFIGATWNPSDKTANVTLSNADLTGAANNSTNEECRATRNNLNTTSGGKFYWEVVVDVLAVVADLSVGIKQTSTTITSGTNFEDGGGSYAAVRGNSARVTSSGWSSGPAPDYAAGDILMFGLNLDDRTIFFGKNGTWQGDPVLGTGWTFNLITEGVDFAPLFATGSDAGAVQVTLVSHPDDLTYSAPSGYIAGLEAP